MKFLKKHSKEGILLNTAAGGFESEIRRYLLIAE